MQNKYSKVLLAIIAVILLAWNALKHFNANNKSATTTSANTSVSSQDNNEAFRHHRFKYSNHARCRMDCRNITEQEISEVVQHGKVNTRKSDLNAAECPRYAVEELTDEKNIRVIVGDCENEAVIITVIDLDHEFDCHCPGDESK